MKSLNYRLYYPIWEDNSSTIEAERRGYHFTAKREPCTDNWILKIWEIHSGEPIVEEHFKLVSYEMILSKINDVFKTLPKIKPICQEKSKTSTKV